jgi:hypothetical protein
MSNRVQAPGYSRVTLSRPSDLAFYPRYDGSHDFPKIPLELSAKPSEHQRQGLLKCVTDEFSLEISDAAAFSPGGKPSSISNMMTSAADLSAASNVAGLLANTNS